MTTNQSEATPEVRYAAYDRTYKRFVGPVTTRKPSRDDLKKLAEQHNLGKQSDLEVREV